MPFKHKYDLICLKSQCILTKTVDTILLVDKFKKKNKKMYKFNVYKSYTNFSAFPNILFNVYTINTFVIIIFI